MSLSFHHPQALILLLLAPVAIRYLARRPYGVSAVLRILIAALAVLILSRPRLERIDPGADLVLLVDRSASCGDETERMAREIAPLLRHQAGPGDRVAVIGFGDGAMVERGFAGETPGYGPEADFAMASDLAAALRLAGSLREPARRTALLYLGDGRHTGENPASADVLSSLRDAPFWFRRVGGPGGLDVAACGVSLPDSVQPRSAWPVGMSVYANAATGAELVLSRNGVEVERRRVELARGDNHFFARDSVGAAGLLSYRLEARAEGDVQPRNNAAAALTRAGEAPRALVVSESPGAGLLGESLRGAAIPVDVVVPHAFPESPALLVPYKLVVVENCQLSDFPVRGVKALAEAARAGATSILVTGGPNSFGMGGYHRSELDPLLPVEMELRNETRRGAMAVAMALDRSGSMAAPAESGATKMDLANLGAAESIRLLSQQDQVSVIAVDSAAHLVVPLSLADSVGGLIELTLSIEAMGGGIFCRTAIEAAAGELRKSDLRSRHIILFADASDAEEQDGCLELARLLLAEGIGLSVVAMGEPGDPDADFLIELARAGGGEALFSGDAAGLPALFTQEIMRVSRRGFLEERVTPRLLPAAVLLGATADAPPSLDGYNVGAAREGAVVYMRLDDEFLSPLVLSRSLGRASTGAVLFEVDGEFSGEFGRWPDAPAFLVSLARRLVPGAGAAGVKAYTRMERGVATVEAEFDEESAAAARAAGDLRMKWLGPGGETLETSLEWIAPDRAQSSVSPRVPGHYLPLIDIPGLGVASAPAASLPYSAEFEPADAWTGLETLRELADLTGGGDGLDLPEVRRSARAARRSGRDLSQVLLAAIMILFLLELSIRRLLWAR